MMCGRAPVVVVRASRIIIIAAATLTSRHCAPPTAFALSARSLARRHLAAAGGGAPALVERDYMSIFEMVGLLTAGTTRQLAVIDAVLTPMMQLLSRRLAQSAASSPAAGAMRDQTHATAGRFTAAQAAWASRVLMAASHFTRGFPNTTLVEGVGDGLHGTGADPAANLAVARRLVDFLNLAARTLVMHPQVRDGCVCVIWGRAVRCGVAHIAHIDKKHAHTEGRVKKRNQQPVSCASACVCMPAHAHERAQRPTGYVSAIDWVGTSMKLPATSCMKTTSMRRYAGVSRISNVRLIFRKFKRSQMLARTTSHLPCGAWQ